MARFGKPDAKGRSSGKLARRERKLRSPPKGEPWVWHTRELLESPAWRRMGIHSRRLIDFLELEYMAGAGRENGNLKATYDQLARCGITRRKIHKAILEAEDLGLVRVEHGGRWNMTNQPSLFALTYFADAAGNPATNDWKRIADEAENQNRDTKKDTTEVSPEGTTGATRQNPIETKSARINPSCSAPVVPHGGISSIFAPPQDGSGGANAAVKGHAGAEITRQSTADHSHFGRRRRGGEP